MKREVDEEVDEDENKGIWKREGRREKRERIEIRMNIKGYGKEKEEERREEAGWNEKMKSSMGSNSNTAILNGEMSSQIDTVCRRGEYLIYFLSFSLSLSYFLASPSISLQNFF